MHMRRCGESPPEPWRHAPVLNRGAFDSPNQYLQEEQHLFYGGALVRPGAGLGRRRTPPKFTCKGLPLRHGESPSEPWRHAPVINRGAFDSPNHYLHAGQLLSRGVTLVGPGNALKSHKNGLHEAHEEVRRDPVLALPACLLTSKLYSGAFGSPNHHL